jgi:hypothetical protein
MVVMIVVVWVVVVVVVHTRHSSYTSYRHISDRVRRTRVVMTGVGMGSRTIGHGRAGVNLVLHWGTHSVL